MSEIRLNALEYTVCPRPEPDWRRSLLLEGTREALETSMSRPSAELVPVKLSRAHPALFFKL